MRKIAIAGLFVLAAAQLHAQSKVFKEVGEDISSQIMSIQQDNSLVGYIAFTQLEKASEDSFNYRLTIMDENLNDIGVVNFRQQKLILQNVAFEQDVLCLGYLKSNIIGKDFKNWKAMERAENKNSSHNVFFQFLNLQGTIIKAQEIPATISLTLMSNSATGGLNTPIQIRNIPQHGFVCYYEDDSDKTLAAYDLTGSQAWIKKIGERDSKLRSIINTETEIYLLTKKKIKAAEGGYEVFPFSASSGKAYPKYELKDKDGQYMKVLDFDLDPATKKPYISGSIINLQYNNTNYGRSRDIINGIYAGVFTVAVKGPEKNNFEQICSYWSDGSQTAFNKQGYFKEQKRYENMYHSFRDQDGNTYFAASSFVRKAKIGSIVASVVTIPFIFPPFLISAGGYTKVKTKNALIVRQDSKGTLSITDDIDWTSGRKFYPTWVDMFYFDRKSFYSVSKDEIKNSHLILNDSKKIIVYNLKKHKEERSIAIKEGSVRTDVFPAKDGHIMIAEYDKKAKSTTISIESL